MPHSHVKEVPAPRLVCVVELNPGPATLCLDTRRKVIWYKQDEGLTNKAIARKLNNIDKNVRNILKKFKETGSGTQPPRAGPKTKIRLKAGESCSKESK